MNLDALEALYGCKKEDANESLSNKEIFAEEPLNFEEEIMITAPETKEYVPEVFPYEDTIQNLNENYTIENNISQSNITVTTEPEAGVCTVAITPTPTVQNNLGQIIEDIKLPTLPKLSFPKFNFPKFQTPKFNFKRLSFWKIKIISELKILIILFFTVFSAFFFFTNAKLVLITVNDVIGTNEETDSTNIIEDFEEHSTAEITMDKQEKLMALEENFENLKKDQREKQEMTLNMQEFLDQKQETHELNFNILPPTNRLIIPDLNVNIPLIDIPVIWEADFENENFEEELTQGAVKYPTTATPWEQGNSLIFGHSSTEWWKHNEYWFVFRNLPRLQAWQKIQVIWNGQLYTYEMIERKVVLPKEVESYYNEFQKDGESYLTLMGCYPIGSNAKRMMVVAKKINN